MGSVVTIAIRPVVDTKVDKGTQGGGIAVLLKGEGAGAVLFRSFNIGARSSWTDADPVSRLTDFGSWRERVAGPEADTPFDLRLGGAGDPTVVSAFGEAGDVPIDSVQPIGRPVSVGSAWELVVSGDVGWDAPLGQIGSIALQRLEVGGFEPVVEPAMTRSAAVNWAIGAGPGDIPEDDPVLVGLVRLDRSVLDRAARDWGPARRARLFADAWTTAAHWHRGDPAVMDALLAAPPMDDLAPGERLPLDVATGDALLRIGHLGEARSRLVSAWEQATASGLPAWQEAFDAAALLADLSLADGDEEAAAYWTARAREAPPDADLARRLLQNRPSTRSSVR